MHNIFITSNRNKAICCVFKNTISHKNEFPHNIFTCTVMQHNEMFILTCKPIKSRRFLYSA